MRITVSMYEIYANQCLHIYTERTHTEASCVCVSYKPLNADNNQGRMHANSDTKTSHVCISYLRMILVLLQRTSPFSYRSKLRGQCSDVKIGCASSVSHCLNPLSLS